MTPAADERWRCFVAIDLAEPARSALTEYLATLRAEVAAVAWTRPDNLHLTLAFLGDVAPSRIPSLAASLRSGLGETASCDLQVVGVGAFPNVARPQVLWVAVTCAELAAIAERVQAACEAAGFPREARAFRPHVTLGRVRTRSRRGKPDLAFLGRDGRRVFGTAAVDEIVLYRSKLSSAGAQHLVLERFRLRPDQFS